MGVDPPFTGLAVNVAVAAEQIVVGDWEMLTDGVTICDVVI